MRYRWYALLVGVGVLLVLLGVSTNDLRWNQMSAQIKESATGFWSNLETSKLVDESTINDHQVKMGVNATSIPNKVLPLSLTTCNRKHVQDNTTINDLPKILQQWALTKDEQCRGLFTLFKQHFHVQWRTGKLRLPGPFEKKMFNWLGQSLSALRQAKRQTIIFINNKLTSEGVIINPLRQKRPKSSKFLLSEYQYATKLSYESAVSCDFCRYTNFTAHDVFGRLESKYSFTAANAFKLDQWHGLVVFKKHHPLAWTLEHFKDAMELSTRWYGKALLASPSYLYKYLTWDLLPASGSSQVHPHMHLFLSPNPYGHSNKWYRLVDEYKQTHPGRDYFHDLILLHTQLNLDVKHGDATALVYLTPVRNNEIVVIAPDASNHFFELVFFMLRAYIDKLQAGSFSMVVVPPALSGPHSKMPAMAWMVSRGSNQDVRADITSMEMFASSNIDVDFFQLTRSLREFKSDQLKHNSTKPSTRQDHT